MAKKKQLEKTKSYFDQCTPKEQVFVKEYIVDFNASRAALESGATHASCQVTGCNMLKRPRVALAIAESLKPMMEEAELTAEKVLKQLHNFLFYDITPYISEDGTLKCAPGDLPEAIRQSIKEIDGDQRFDRDGNVSGSSLKIRLVSKESAMKLALQYLKLVGPDVNVEGDVNIQQNFFQQFYQQAQQPASGPVTIEQPKQEVITNGKASTNGNGKAH